MASSNGNRHVLQEHEWANVRTGKWGPWARCVADQATMHPGGGMLEVYVVADHGYPEIGRRDVTDAVLTLAGE